MAPPKDSYSASHDRYTRVAIVLHWAIATLMIFNLCTGFFMANWLAGPSASSQPIRWLSLMLHVSSGMTVLALTIVRVSWRLLHDPPPYPPGMKPWERHTAHIAHFLLYAAMVLMPLLGWGILSAHPPPGSPGAAAGIATPPIAPPGGAPRILKVWNLFPLPSIAPIEAIGQEPGGVAAQHVLHKEFAQWHGVGGYLLLGLLVLHLLGALKHQFIDKLPEFARMGIGRAR
jgi:cytochrome b561